MSLFSPYKIECQSNRELHLAESSARRKFLFFFFRMLPFILLFLLWRVISIEELPNDFKYILGPLILVIVLLLFFKKYIVEVVINRECIELKEHSIFSEKLVTIVTNEIEKITVREIHGRGGGYFYKLILKDGSRKTFFTIPVIYVKDGKLQQINELLSSITSLEVEKL